MNQKPKGRRNIGRPRKRWRDQIHRKDQGTGNTPNPSGTWWWWWWTRSFNVSLTLIFLPTWWWALAPKLVFELIMKKLLVVFDWILFDSCKVRPCAGFILHFDVTVRRYYFQYVSSEEVSEQNCLLRLFSTSRPPPPQKFYPKGSVNYDIPPPRF